MALVRKPGVATRDANYDQLSNQFSLDPHKVRDLNKSRIVLIEDVVTTGRTVSICAEKLADAGPEAVDVLALARATRL
jgi:predicted amidophosphoribosyltransferase